MAQAFVGALSALGLNLVAGYAGQLNLAHAGFVAIGAYTVGIITVHHGVPFRIACALAGVASAAAGAAVGLVSLRLGGDTFAVFTLCVGFHPASRDREAGRADARRRRPDGHPEPPGLGPVSFATDRGQCCLALAALALGVWLTRRITASLVDRSFLAIRNGEALAQALGLNPMRTDLTAFVVSTFYAGQVRFIDPDIAGETRSFDALIFAVVGGMGTPLGPVVGAVGMGWMIRALQGLQDHRMLVFAPLLIPCIVFFPSGIVGAIEARFAQAAPICAVG